MASDLTVLKGGAKLTQRLDLGEFNTALVGDFLSVWLNVNEQFWADWHRLISRETALQEKIAALQAAEPGDLDTQALDDVLAGLKAERELLEQDAYEFMGTFWGCGAEDAQAIFQASPPLYTWCVQRAFALLDEYMTGKKKR